MDRGEAHKLLRGGQKGVAEWNRRREEGEEIPQLSGAGLSEADLTEADLREAHLLEADLTEADLRRANLYKASLYKADLRRANLYKASLYKADLRRANLRQANLIEADLRRANLYKANFAAADLTEASLREANLIGANLLRASLYKADLTEADLRDADLYAANLSGADLVRAELSEANLMGANLSETNLEAATLAGCRIFGISAWNVNLAGAEQSDLIITKDDEAEIVVDDLEVAQFTYLLLNNEKLRNVIDTIGEKGVLILGRFTPERKAVLDAMRTELRRLGFVPMMFDFEKPTQRDFTETIKTLAGLSRFIIADITNPRSSPLELQATMPDYMIPFVPIIQENEEPFAMFQDLQQKYGWVLDVLRYDTPEHLIRKLKTAVVNPALKKADELLLKKAEATRTRHLSEYEESEP